MHSTSHMGCTRPHELYRVAFVKRDALPHRRRHPFPMTWSQRDSVRSGSQEDLKGAAKVCWAHPTGALQVLPEHLSGRAQAGFSGPRHGRF